ncbi:hypothetical protein PM082_020228 [Marasmius tenuissimus]|nr:hypothetical protein PM082_020228 [Marasmius tenuissimus]
MSSNVLSAPSTPTKTRSKTKTYTSTVTDQSPGRVVTRTTTRTTVEVITETPTSSTPTSNRSTSRRSQSTASDADIDNPNDDATISFSTAADTSTITPPSLRSSRPATTPQSQCSLRSSTTSRSQQSQPPSLAPQRSGSTSTSAHVTTATSSARSMDHELISYYEDRYPGKVPHPQTLASEVNRTSTKQFYVVTSGLQVGIFTNWTFAASLVIGVSRAKHESHGKFYDAWIVYYREYRAKNIHVLSEYQDTAPLQTQLVDNGLAEDVANLSL